jgi:3-phosphoshikimate 1-carboxyvinyltransferase
MGGNLTQLNRRTVSGEEVCDLLVTSSALKGTIVEGEQIPTLIDELPMIAVMAAFAEGTTIIRDAAELKVKESNRIETVVYNLRCMGADVTPTEDGMIIRGNPQKLHAADFNSFLDHRIAMAFAVAALALPDGCTMADASCVNISYPAFYEDLTGLIQ